MHKLEFKPEIFSSVIDRFGDREFITSSYGDHEVLCRMLAEEANFRLAPISQKIQKLEELLKSTLKVLAIRSDAACLELHKEIRTELEAFK